MPYIAVPVDSAEGAEVILVEITGPTAGPELAATPTEVVKRAAKALGELVDEQLKPVASAVVQSVRSMAHPPAETTIEFGLRLDAEARFVVAGATAEASFKVTMTWRHPSPDPSPPSPTSSP